MADKKDDKNKLPRRKPTNKQREIRSKSNADIKVATAKGELNTSRIEAASHTRREEMAARETLASGRREAIRTENAAVNRQQAVSGFVTDLHPPSGSGTAHIPDLSLGAIGGLVLGIIVLYVVVHMGTNNNPNPAYGGGVFLTGLEGITKALTGFEPFFTQGQTTTISATNIFANGQSSTSNTNAANPFAANPFQLGTIVP